MVKSLNINMVQTFLMYFLLVWFVSRLNAESAISQCRDRIRFISSEVFDAFQLVDVEKEQTITLNCHFCGEVDDGTSKIWYKMPNVLTKETQEVELGMSSNLSSNRVLVTTNHALIIHNLTEKDSAMYQCHGNDGEKKEYEYNYYVDVHLPTRTPAIMSGNLTKWMQYQAIWLQPANYIITSNFVGRQRIIKTNIKFQVYTEWQAWGPCITCHTKKSERRRIGRCRIKSSRYDARKEISSNISDNVRTLNLLSRLHCRSLTIQRMGIEMFGTSLWIIPDFILSEECGIVCDKGYEREIDVVRAVRPKIFINMPVGTDKFFTCPGAKPVSVVTWKKDKLLFEKIFNTTQITVDDLGTLWIHLATKKVSGNYTCYIDGKKIQEIWISVITQARFISLTLKRCFACRSRGDKGSCKDPFKLNATMAEEERGVEAVPCASGWCGKFLEGGATLKDDDYGVATQRLCLQRGPSDNEERCDYTQWNHKKVYMCFCRGDLCNSSPVSRKIFYPTLLLPIVLWLTI